MYRLIDDYLAQWHEDKYRKPLVIQGARQVGKTYAVLEFGRKHYDNVAYFNFKIFFTPIKFWFLWTNILYFHNYILLSKKRIKYKPIL